jgi:hypothetical protein
MSIPDFERAEYIEPQVVDGETGLVEGSPKARNAAFPLALSYGVGAAVVGAVGYALVGLTGFMVSIVTIGIGYIVARAMMTATRGFGGREYQVAAVILTYLSASVGRVIDILVEAHKQGYDISRVSIFFLVKYSLFGPFLRFLDGNPFWAGIGLLILFYGLRTAWQLAAGSPGFGQQGGPRMTVMGLRR